MDRSGSWKQSGSIFLWRYTENARNYPGWHLTADGAGCQLIVDLLDAFAAGGVAASRTVEIKPPSRAQLGVPNNRSGLAAWQAPAGLRIVLSGDPAEWTFPFDTDPAVLTLGSDWLAPFREGISGIPCGRGDHSIGPRGKGSARLWFWW